MQNPSSQRHSMAVIFGVILGFAQMAALIAIVLSARSFFLSPIVQDPLNPIVLDTQVVGSELVIPLVPYSDRDLTILRFVDIRTGRTRELKPSPIFPLRGLVSNGNKIWIIGDQNEICETDGTTIENYRTEHLLSIKPGELRTAFLYENRPAILDRPADGTTRLLALVDHQWQDRGRVVFPGELRLETRTWITDLQTCKSVMAPRTSDGAINTTKGDASIVVLPIQGQMHLFQVFRPSSQPNNTDFVVAHRVGFEFVVDQAADQPVSVLAPENAPAEATGWELFPVTFSGRLWQAASNDGQLWLVDSKAIWRQSADNASAPPEFERLMEVDQGHLSLTTDEQTNDMYALAQTRRGEVDVFRWNGTGFDQLPYRIDGLGTPIMRGVGVILGQLLAVLWIGSALMIVSAAWLTNRTGLSSFSFGQETVPLAPLVRRSIARLLDLMLIFTPLIAQILWIIWHANTETIFDRLFNTRAGHQIDFRPLIPALTWLTLTWPAMIVSTAIWGVSPGKWLCRVRVVRSTLRRCGLAHALLREALLCLDAPLLITAFPAVISWLATDHRQRIGDHFADTIVIDSPR